MRSISLYGTQATASKKPGGCLKHSDKHGWSGYGLRYVDTGSPKYNDYVLYYSKEFYSCKKERVEKKIRKWVEKDMKRVANLPTVTYETYEVEL